VEIPMNAYAVNPFRWTTASFPDATDTSPMELSELGEHVDRCNGSRGRWFTLRCAADAVHDFVAPRFVTTLFIAAAVIGIAAFAF
jgi:hypothetical protein